MTLSSVADSAAMVTAGPRYRQVDGDYVSAVFSPDGRSVILTDPGSKETRLVDAITGGMDERITWSAGEFSGWQRLAP